MSQNSDLEARRKDFQMLKLDENLKKELRESHFLLGNFQPNYNTVFQSEYTKKKVPFNNSENKSFANNNKAYSHKMGSDRITYNSESHTKFISPAMNRTASNRSDTCEVQSSHYTFGKDKHIWETTNQTVYQEKVRILY